MNYITDSNYEEFKRLYLLARDTDKTTFMFNDQLVLTSYAKYVCEYVERGDAEHYHDNKGGSDDSE